MKPISFISSSLCLLTALWLSFACGQEPAAPAVDQLFARDNLVAWCIVPFDAAKRGPKARAEMLNRLGFKSLAYDYRDEHISQFDEEIKTLREHGIDLAAWWCGGVDPHNPVSGSITLALDALSRNQDSADLWVMFNEAPLQSLDQPARVKLVAEAMDKIAVAVAAVKGRVGIYNHGGWCGDPANQLAVAKACHEKNTGVVFNFHHAHEHFNQLPALLKELAPHLICLNLNGMTIGGEKILPVGSGKSDREMLQMVRVSGYTGPIGILDHRPELDAELSLKQNLDGLERLLQK